MLNPNEVLPSDYRVGKPNPHNGGTSDPRLVDGAFPLDEPDWKDSRSFKRTTPAVAFYPYGDPTKRLLRHTIAFTLIAGLGLYASRQKDPQPDNLVISSTPTTIFASPTPSATPVHFQ